MSADPISHVRVLGKIDPAVNLATQYGEARRRAVKNLAYLVADLRELDGLAKSLKEHGITVTIDLGPIGNAAAAARRDLNAPHTFDRGRRT